MKTGCYCWKQSSSKGKIEHSCFLLRAIWSRAEQPAKQRFRYRLQSAGRPIYKIQLFFKIHLGSKVLANLYFYNCILLALDRMNLACFAWLPARLRELFQGKAWKAAAILILTPDLQMDSYNLFIISKKIFHKIEIYFIYEYIYIHV